MNRADHAMFLSIIIPSYNRSSKIRFTLESILRQTLRDFEVIVVDDGSDDNTLDVVGSIEDSRVRYIKKQNEERGAARNFGLNLSYGEYINFFDSDDIFEIDLNDVKDFINNNSQPPVIFGDIQLISEEGTKSPAASARLKSFTNDLLQNNFLACGSVFLRREVAFKFQFNERRDLSTAEDWELWLRIHSQYRFTHLPRVIFQQVQHDNRSLVKIDPERIQIRDILLSDLVGGNEELIRFYGRSRLKLFVADRFTFIALSWCRIDNAKAFHYWVNSLASSVLVMSRRRFWAVLKKLLFR